MKEAWTLGRGLRKRRFGYVGSVTTGVQVVFRTSVARVSAGFFRALLGQFAGCRVRGGFDQTMPTPGGLGEWVSQYSRLLNETGLTPRHASFVAAVLVNEGYAEATLEGNAICLIFRAAEAGQVSLLVPRLLPPEGA
jgi:hypothetical protein